jgi:hypothetical protein
MIGANDVAISSNQRVVSDPDRLPGAQIGVSADKHITSGKQRWFAVSLRRAPNSTLALNERAGAKFQPWLHVSPPSQFDRFMNHNPLPPHFSEPRLAQAPSSQLLIGASDRRSQRLLAMLPPY